MTEKKNIRLLNKSESKAIIKLAKEKGILKNTDNIKQLKVLDFSDNVKIFLIDDYPLFFERMGKLYPTLFNEIRSTLPSVIVDDGAISHILNGADVMAPGIINFPSNVKEEDLVVVKSQNNKILSIGTILESFKEKLQERKGKVIKNVHYVGDDLFKVCMKIIKEGKY